jgi:hypothetical protein
MVEVIGSHTSQRIDQGRHPDNRGNYSVALTALQSHPLQQTSRDPHKLATRQTAGRQAAVSALQDHFGIVLAPDLAGPAEEKSESGSDGVLTFNAR